MYLGVDLGTSAVKALLVDGAQQPVAQASAALDLQRPQPLWSEQDPHAWWDAACNAIDSLRTSNRRELAAVRGIGLSGQMHGATLLDGSDQVLRPAMLWNDGRSGPQCAQLEERLPELQDITGNLAMPGFTAPKLMWVKQHEPDLFKQVAKVLLPKDYLRLRLSGDHGSDMSDSAGTLWLDVGKRAWSPEVLAATDLDVGVMPTLHEGSQATGVLRDELKQRWGMGDSVPIAAGAGDNAAGAAGLGVTRPGEAFLSLGTSGVYFVADDRFAPNTASAVHTFCHCLPGRWHQMSVILSAASCLSWYCGLIGKDEATLLRDIEADATGPSDALFLPYLSGERTPHNDPHARGVFFGLGHEDSPASLGRAVLEGVAFALADGQQGLIDAGTGIDEVSVIGGGARSRYWGRILASVLGRSLSYRAGAELGAAFGAARLARLAVTGEAPDEVCTAQPVEAVVDPDPAWQDRYAAQLPRFRRLYSQLKEEFR